MNHAGIGRFRETNLHRFTLAHELGHYFIDQHRRGLEEGKVRSHGSVVEFESELPIEQEADTFAASLLMPRERFSLWRRPPV